MPRSWPRVKPEFSGAALAEIMERHQLSNRELAAAVGVTEGSITNWRRGYRRPQSSKLAALIEVLGVTEADLMTSSGPMVYASIRYNAKLDKCLCNHLLSEHSTRIPSSCSQCSCKLFRSVYKLRKAQREDEFWDRVGTE